MREELACERDGHARGMGMPEGGACEREGHARGRGHARRIGMREKNSPARDKSPAACRSLPSAGIPTGCPCPGRSCAPGSRW